MTQAKKLGKQNQTLLYCSFCGKSQNEVKKLIAGPTVFICDECAVLCSDIIFEEGDKSIDNDRRRIFVSVELEESGNPADQQFLPSLMDGIQKAFPGSKASIKMYRRHGNVGILGVEFQSLLPIARDEREILREEIRKLTIALRIEQQKLIVERGQSKRFEELYRELQDVVMPALVDRLKREGKISDYEIKSLLILFMDVANFSRMNERAREINLDFLRGVIRKVIAAERVFYINTWGDGLIAAFDSVNDGLKCAWKIFKHLEIDGIDVRIGIHWGNARIIMNQVTQQLDIDGSSIDVGARLEPLADAGEILVTEDVRFHPEVASELFEFTSTSRTLKKLAGSLPAGTKIDVFRLRYLPNQ